jgi:short subunit dehydrogenase-like uncharacterized protein
MLAVELAELAVKAAETPQVSRLAVEAADLLKQVAPGSVKKLADGVNTAVNWLEKAKRVDNPYLRDFEETQTNPAYKRSMDIVRHRVDAPEGLWGFAYRKQLETRYALTHKYAWAVPNAEALATIAEQGKVVDAGAGSGYWSSLLRKMDVDVVAFDKHGMDLSSNHFHKTAVRPWTDIVKGDAQTVSAHGDRTLFMSFPPDGEPFGHDVLNQYRGDKFVYVGEERGGVTGDEKFFDLLDKQWKQTKFVEIPRWECSDGLMRDAMQVFERR